jgi:hypothetical protein
MVSSRPPALGPLGAASLVRERPLLAALTPKEDEDDESTDPASTRHPHPTMERPRCQALNADPFVRSPFVFMSL